MKSIDAVILGAGAAGMMCAIEAARRGRSVVVIDHARAPGEKIRVSGGGRCNFTNTATAPERFLSQNPRFAISALSRFTPADFIARVDRAGIAWHEKTLGQLFCDGSARQIVEMLCTDMSAAGAQLWLGCPIREIGREAGPGGLFTVRTDRATLRAGALVLATGGKSIPKMGATGLALDLAQKFGLGVTETRPGLVPLTYGDQMLAALKPLAGVSVDATISTGRTSFREGLLFTHRGLSGPSVLQISSYWREGQEITVDFCPGRDLGALLAAQRQDAGKATLLRALGRHLPERLAEVLLRQAGLGGRLGDQPKAALAALAETVHRWQSRPVGTEGYRTAEVMLGGIDTAGLLSQSMEARQVPGLYAIGEAVDVTGWLGGYNFQWAWSSGWAAGQTL